MAKMIEKLMIWDGNNHFRRCAGNKGLMRLTFKDKQTGAIHGTIKRILTDIQTFKPTECVVVFDGAGARVEKQKVYEGYKAHRTAVTDFAKSVWIRPHRRNLMKTPNHITSLALHNLIDSQTEINGKWVPARPRAVKSIGRRFKLAWWVLIGKADALTWPGQ